jgi:phospholipase C
VEWRFGLPALTPRDAASNNLAHVLDFDAPDASRPEIVVPPDPGPDPCAAALRAAAGAAEDDGITWEELAASDLVQGWALG